MIDAHTLQKEIINYCDDEQLSWLLSALTQLEQGKENIEPIILKLSPSVKRRFPQQVEFKNDVLAAWQLWDAVRLLLLLVATVGRNAAMSHQILYQYFKAGDTDEKIALLKGLSCFDESVEYLDIALTAARVNDPEIFSSLALFNSYPGVFFPELNWNQMVLKSLHLKFDIQFIRNLESRQNPALSVMVSDYIEELLLAGRGYPSSGWLAVDFHHLNKVSDRLVSALLELSDVNVLHHFLNTAKTSQLSSDAKFMIKNRCESMSDVALQNQFYRWIGR